MSEIHRDMIKSVLMGIDDAGIRYQFVSQYSSQLEQFLDHMTAAFAAWRRLDTEIAKDIPGAHVSCLLYGALNAHVVAMKLLICGLLVPAGNSQRYVLESLATALLVSKPDLGFLKRYIDNEHSTNKSIGYVKKHARALNLDREALNMLEDWSNLYNQHSHPTILSSASLFIRSAEGVHSVLGGCFDKTKAFAYDKEIESRVSLASVLTNIIDGVLENYCGGA